MKKPSLTLLLVVILVVVGYLAYRQHKISTDTTDALLPVSTAGAPSIIPTYAWEITPVSADNGTPKTAIVLTVNGALYPIGMSDGDCNALAVGQKGIGGEMADPDEITRVQCSYAGSGEEIGLFSDNGVVTVKTGELSEGSGGSTPFRGNFKTVLTL